MKKTILFFALTLFLNSGNIWAQHYINRASSAIQIHLPINYRNSNLSIIGQQLQINHRGSELYIANLYPGNYHLTIRNGARLIRMPISLQNNMLMRILIASNGKLIRQPQHLIFQDRNFPENSWGNKDYNEPYEDAPLNNEDYEYDLNNPYPSAPQKESIEDWKKEFYNISFDTKKVDYLNQTLNFKIDYNTAKELLKSFDSDYNRIKAAKKIKTQLYNPSEAVGLIETFSHDAYKKEFQNML